MWSLLLFPLLDTHSPVALAIGMIVTAGIVGGAIPSLVTAPLAAAYGNFAIGILLCALSLRSLFCTKVLVETKGRDLRQARPSTAAIR